MYNVKGFGKHTLTCGIQNIPTLKMPYAVKPIRLYVKKSKLSPFTLKEKNTFIVYIKDVKFASRIQNINCAFFLPSGLNPPRPGSL